MYRKAEFRLFIILNALSGLFCAGTVAAVIFYFWKNQEAYRNLSLVFLILSIFFQVQIFLYKMTVMERRMLYLVGLSEQHFEIAQRRGNLHLVFFFIIFWIALFSVIFTFIPLRG